MANTSVRTASTPRLPRCAFTLLELLVVIAIIGVLIATLIPALGKARAVAERVACASTQRQAGVGFNIYMTDFKNWLPRMVDNVHYQAPSWVTISKMSYLDTVLPDSVRHCGTYNYKSVPGASYVGYNFVCSYAFPLLNCEYAAGSPHDTYYTHMADRLTPDGLYVHVVPGLASPGNGVPDPSVYIWDPTASFPLMTDRNSFFAGDYDRITSHRSDGGPAYLVPGEAEFQMAGANSLWLDGHVEWHNWTPEHLVYYPISRIPVGGWFDVPGETGVDGWCNSGSQGFTVFWVKAVLK